MSPEDRIFQQRFGKIARISDLGFERYPHRYDATHTVEELRSAFDPCDGDTLEEDRPATRVCGRLTTKRRQGRAGFANLKQGGVQIQLYVRKDEVPERDFELYKLLDAGDVIGVAGRVFRTRTNELTVRASGLEFLSKSVLPPPEKFHGLQDVEIRYRQRSLDLMSNDSVRETFVKRDRIVRTLRNCFQSRGYIEVETPMMQPVYGGALARPFLTHHNALDIDLYLRIAPELYLKRLTVGGLDRVYEINRNFRNEGLSKQHNPEFTMLEFYEAYSDYRELMRFSGELLRTVAESVLDGGVVANFGRHRIDFGSLNCLTLPETVSEYWPDAETRPDPDELADVGKIRELAAVHERNGNSPVRLPEGVSAGVALLALFEAACEPRLVQPTAVYDYPVEASPLSKQKPDDSDWVERFEIFCGGMEIANGYSELNDPMEQLLRFEEQAAAREAGDREAHGVDEDYVRALCYGLPPTAGEGIGIDRLTMLLTDSPTIRDVILFPLMRPEGEIRIADRLRRASRGKGS
ncbi:MAG: lysine--tRNA ligase [Bryobacterales bacterium]|nr:lysine--tRNA ligase [Bryobacterales bacterium]MDE0626801.1 lysine--tRNA ligase [Bryobacterales bacterium]